MWERDLCWRVSVLTDRLHLTRSVHVNSLRLLSKCERNVTVLYFDSAHVSVSKHKT